MSTHALIIVDVQNDFVEGGSLAVTGGRAVASAISSYLATHAGDYAAIVASRDWHTPDDSNGGHFAAPGSSPDYTTTWPVHCLAHEHGSDYAVELAYRHITHHVKKGMGEPAYSAFQGVTADGDTMTGLLTHLGVTDVDVVGIATDYCVKATAIDAARGGWTTRLLAGLHAGVAADTTAAALAAMTAAGVAVPELDRAATA